MNILVLTTEAFGGHGGIAQYNRDLLTALCSHPRVSSATALVRLAPGALEPLPARLHFITEAAGSKRRFVRHAFKLASQQPFDLVICGHINLLPIAYAVQLAVRAPMALVVYGIEVWQAPRSPLLRALAAQLKSYISISHISSTRFAEWAGFRNPSAFILPNAINLGEYGPGPRSVELARKYNLAGKKVLLTLGRMDAAERYKGFDEILDVMPQLLQEEPRLVYVAAGDGTDRARLMEKAHALKLQDHVLFPGRIGLAEKADLYRAADAFAMPGRGEGFGFVFLEALACGIPVVASTLDGSREAVREGMLGAMVDPDNQAHLKDALLKAIRQGPGLVPQGLHYFEFPGFEQRTHAMVDALTQGAA